MSDPREDVDALIVRTREAHEVLKDIKAATRELKETIELARQVQASLMITVVEVVDNAIGETVESGLQNYSRAIDIAIDEAQDAVYERFDLIAAILMGGTDETEMTLEDGARLIRKTLDKKETLTAQETWQMDQIHETLRRRIGDR
jgi:hypothetical protein